jgi:hypothetical protein
MLTAPAVVEEISALDTRLLVVEDRVVERVDGGGGETGRGVAFCGFGLSSPSGIISSFSSVAQLKYE